MMLHTMHDRSLSQVALILGLVALTLVAWLGRYDMVAVQGIDDPAVSQQGQVMLIDRWTGRVNYCFARYVTTACYSFDPDPPWDT